MKKWIVLLLVLVLLLAAAVAGGYFAYQDWYQDNHIITETAVYEKDIKFLDLRGTGATLEYYESLRQQLPGCEIRYDLPFQGGFYPDDTQELTITSLTAEEVELLDYLPRLSRVDARNCTDYDQLLALQQRRPDCQVLYTVALDGETYDQSTTEMTFGEKQPQYEELSQVLAWLPQMQAIHFEQPQLSGRELAALREAYPDITITWVKDAFGTTYPDDVTEIELSKMYFSSLEEIEQQASYFPSLEKLVLLDCGYDAKNLFDDETLAAFREKMRPNYKVVWSMNLYGMIIRTDDLYFMPNKYGVKVSTYGVQRLRYCEDMLCVDLGHHNIVDLSFVEGMPHLKYFICIDSKLLYIEPLSTCKELVYCELFWTPISDFTPLLGCTALEDLNVARTHGDPMVFKDMPWLKNLWIKGSAVDAEERKILEEALPDTNIVYCDYEMTRNGWRDLPNYFAMRDLLGMGYNRW